MSAKSSMQFQYLVLAYCQDLDVPVSWHQDRQEAFDVAESLEELPAEYALMFGLNDIMSQVLKSKVVVFQNGKPVECIKLVGSVMDFQADEEFE